MIPQNVQNFKIIFLSFPFFSLKPAAKLKVANLKNKKVRSTLISKEVPVMLVDPFRRITAKFGYHQCYACRGTGVIYGRECSVCRGLGLIKNTPCFFCNGWGLVTVNNLPCRYCGGRGYSDFLPFDFEKETKKKKGGE